MIRLSSLAAVCGLCLSASFAEEPATLENLKRVAERLREKAFPNAKLFNPGAVSVAWNQPTMMLQVPDAGARAKRLKPKKVESAGDTLRRFFDNVSSLNIENRLYVTQFSDSELASAFVKERNGATALADSVNARAIANGVMVLWGDKRLVDKAQKHWQVILAPTTGEPMELR